VDVSGLLAEGAGDLVGGGCVAEAIAEPNLGIASILVELPVSVSLSTKNEVQQRCEEAVRKIEWVKNPLVVVTAPEGQPEAQLTSSSSSSSSSSSGEGAGAGGDPAAADAAPVREARRGGLAGVKRVVAVASCKGGVGKSTTAVNLAFSLKNQGLKVGIVDTDVYGPSLPTMVTPVSSTVTFAGGGTDIAPLEAHGVKLMSMGFINPQDSMVVRGARAAPLVEQLLTRTQWGDLDYLIIDMPPGTGDIQLTLSQALSIDAAVIVTTPQRLSFTDVVKGVEMFDKVGIPCVAVVENMAEWVDHSLVDELKDVMERYEIPQEAKKDFLDIASKPRKIFGPGHRQRLADMWGIENTYSVPLTETVSQAGDTGTPYVQRHPKAPAAQVFSSLASDVIAEVEMLDSTRQQMPKVEYDVLRNLVVSSLPDGSEESIAPVELRRRCRSPTNVQELITEDVRPMEIFPMGNYAVQVLWSDGHQSLMPYRSFIEGYPSPSTTKKNKGGSTNDESLETTNDEADRQSDASSSSAASSTSERVGIV